jgi:hypothetical protein
MSVKLYEMLDTPAEYKHTKTYVSLLIVLSTFVYTLLIYSPAVIYAYVLYLVWTPTF